MPVRGIGIAHFNRTANLDEIILAVQATSPADAMIVVADDGSTENVEDICREREVVLIKGKNLGVAANKNRALYALKECRYICLLEDDLMPTEDGWFETYERASRLSGIHHFCRVQDKEVPEMVPAFSKFLGKSGLTPIYGPSVRGDLTFLTSAVVNTVGGFNPQFVGAGYAHGEWSHRVKRSGLINHPASWIDIEQARDKIVQIGDREGGRWETDVTYQLRRNKQVLKELQRQDYTHCAIPLQ
tara:strand:- start:606 stop:1337 length:732 start_codon:yes stop_codon:yes gene_type:complete